MNTLIIIFVILLGLAAGSFLNVLIHRLPRGESILRPGSRCPRCGVPIRWADNIPLISYLLLGGKCRVCRSPIPARYPVVELLNTILWVASYLKFGLSSVFFQMIIFSSLLVALSFIDGQYFLLPDRLVFPGMGVGLFFLFAFRPVPVLSGIGGAVLCAGLLLGIAWLSQWLFRKKGMGGGDIKLTAMVGLFLGWPRGLLALFLAAVLGLVGWSVLVLLGRRRFGDRIPFGIFLALGAWLSLFCGDYLFLGVRSLVQSLL